MEKEQFDLILKQSREAADNTIALTFEMVDKASALASIQITGSRLLATLIGSHMAEKNMSFEDALASSPGIMSGLKKEAIGVFQEIERGEREGI